MRLHRGLQAPLHTVGMALMWLIATLTQPHAAPASANTRAVADHGLFIIQGKTTRAWHIHGGPAANLGQARFRMENHGPQSQRVSVVEIEFLRSVQDCEHPPREVASHPRFGGLFVEDSAQRASTRQIDVKPGAAMDVTVGFAAVPAYYVYCDRFAFRVHFTIGSERVVAVSEAQVTRREPLRHPPADPSAR